MDRADILTLAVHGTFLFIVAITLTILFLWCSRENKRFAKRMQERREAEVAADAAAKVLEEKRAWLAFELAVASAYQSAPPRRAAEGRDACPFPCEFNKAVDGGIKSGRDVGRAGHSSTSMQPDVPALKDALTPERR